jgi:hypothetical protein
MKHRTVSVSWQNDTVGLSRKEQVVISRLRTENHSAMYALQRIICTVNAVKHVMKEMNVEPKAQHGRRVEKASRNW